jgi:hypothetical protein
VEVYRVAATLRASWALGGAKERRFVVAKAEMDCEGSSKNFPSVSVCERGNLVQARRFGDVDAWPGLWDHHHT